MTETKRKMPTVDWSRFPGVWNCCGCRIDGAHAPDCPYRQKSILELSQENEQLRARIAELEMDLRETGYASPRITIEGEDE